MQPPAVHPKLARLSANGAYGPVAVPVSAQAETPTPTASPTASDPRLKLGDVYRGLVAASMNSSSGATES